VLNTMDCVLHLEVEHDVFSVVVVGVFSVEVVVEVVVTSLQS